MYPYTNESQCMNLDKNNNSTTTTSTTATMIKNHRKEPKNLDQSVGQNSDKKSILLSLLCSLFICPIAFHIRNRSSDSLEKDILAAILVITVSAIIVYIVNNVLKQNRFESMRKQLQQQEQINKSNKNTIFNVFNVGQDLKEKLKTNQPKLDSKYFNPRFIVHELMEMWGTTYTVITWSSFYIIGGTIGATERLAQKIKTKYNRQREYQSYETFMNASSSMNRSDSTSTNSTNSSRRQSKSSLRRVSSWTKKSFESTRNRLSRLISSGSEPLLRIGELGDSNTTTSAS